MKNIYILILFFSIFSYALAQDKLTFNVGPGSYLYNSDNGSLIMGNKNFRYQLSYGLSFQKDNLFGVNLFFDYSYSSNKQAKVVEVIVTDYSPSLGTKKEYGDITFSAHNFDLSYNGSYSKNLSYGAGPSFVITNRQFEYYPSSTKLFINDMLAGSGIGAHAYLMFTMPFSEQSPFFFGGKVKLRYTHSIWFDEGIRVLDNYKQSLLTTEINAGIGIIL